MTAEIDAHTLKSWLSDGGEIALLDVREAGQFGEAHPFFAIPLPYSRFELGLPELVPNPAVRIVLVDGGDGVAERAAKRAQDMGYRNLHILAGGAPAWGRAGYTLYAGVNVPSKTFGELVEHQRHTPRITARELQAMREAGENMVIVDGRTPAEYRRMNIPDGISCPNGELALRIHDIAPDPTTKIVVNCAGRTRSIIGAQTLIDFGVPNPVVALENGTQGWFLAGLQLEHGADRNYPDAPSSAGLPERRARARAFAAKHGAEFVRADQVGAWGADRTRTTYRLDVRSEAEHRAHAVASFRHAPGGQLIQATDQWIGVKGARVVLLDDDLVRAPMVAGWLRQLGHEAYVLEGGASAAATMVEMRGGTVIGARTDAGPMTVQELAAALAAGTGQVIDLRPSAEFRKGHIPGAIWSIRPRVVSAADRAKTIVLIGEKEQLDLVGLDLVEAGIRDLRTLRGSFQAWRDAGLPVEATPDNPPDADRIDFLFFTARRHDNDVEAARQYLAWETGLLAQLDEQERGVFRIA
ncbi:MAG TPA: rhodanese-like domain-containing protein [Xanthobacteraceae bacterium]|nr:rhodanese-like domain-containing protein [Xanthobacteraceae bacterium]